MPRKRSFNFCKTGASRFKKRHFQLFKSLRFTPQWLLRRSVFFFKSRRLAVEFRPRQFRFSQKPSLRISKPAVSIFQKPAPHVSKGVTFNFSKAGASRLNDAWGLYFFFISRCLAPEFRLQWFQFFQKPLLRISKAVVFIFKKLASHVSKSGTFNFSKAGAWRLNSVYGGFNFPKNRRFMPQKRGLNFSKAGPTYIKTGRFHFSKVGATRLKKRDFQFLKSRHFTPQCHPVILNDVFSELVSLTISFWRLSLWAFTCCFEFFSLTLPLWKWFYECVDGIIWFCLFLKSEFLTIKVFISL